VKLFESFTFYGYITNSQCDQLPDGLIAQLVEHCTNIAELGHGVESRSGLNFLGGSNFTTAMINHVFVSFSAVQIYDLTYIHLYYRYCYSVGFCCCFVVFKFISLPTLGKARLLVHPV